MTFDCSDMGKVLNKVSFTDISDKMDVSFGAELHNKWAVGNIVWDK